MLLSKFRRPLEGKTPASGLLPHLDLAVTLLLLLRCAWIFAAPLRSADLPLRFAQDDFFYYLKPAQNLVHLHRSTFDGTTLTNGYHPLYFGLLTVISLFVHTIPGVFRALWVVDTVSALAIFLLTRRIFAHVMTRLFANAFALVLVGLCIPLLCDQMEVTLALPLGFAFLCVGFWPGAEFTAKRYFALGLLGALTFLARLDAGLLVLLFVAALLSLQSYRQSLNGPKIIAFIAGIAPLPALYLAINLHFFHTLLPVSGMAKQLRHGHSLSLLLPASFNGRSELLLCVAVCSIVLAWALRRWLLPQERAFLFAVLCTPFLFYGLEMLVSDWPIWNWYFYDLRFAAGGAALLAGIVLCRVLTPGGDSAVGGRLHTTLGWVLLASSCLVVCVQQYKIDHWMVEIQHAAGILDTFARTHPGKYAMGDRAGMFAITADVPVLQTEGLVMDTAYLKHIRAQDDLRQVLTNDGVNYYVVFVFKKNLRWQFTDGCLHAMEPSIAGPDALRMRSDFCEEPVLTFPGFDGEYFVYQLRAG